MNGATAREIRKQIYGEFSSKHREYRRLDNGQIIADRKRRQYQRAKAEGK